MPLFWKRKPKEEEKPPEVVQPTPEEMEKKLEEPKPSGPSLGELFDTQAFTQERVEKLGGAEKVTSLKERFMKMAATDPYNRLKWPESVGKLIDAALKYPSTEEEGTSPVEVLNKIAGSMERQSTSKRLPMMNAITGALEKAGGDRTLANQELSKTLLSYGVSLKI